VTLRGGYERRPDLVLYLNGIAIGVIELKRSSIEVADGVRQLITNQEEIFNKAFFATVQLLFAGSDSQGCEVRHGHHAGGVLCRMEGDTADPLAPARCWTALLPKCATSTVCST
jgi:hypothetical protein